MTRMTDDLLVPGSILGGRYRVDRRVGEGGAGMVYRAEHLVLRQPVAIKVLRAGVAAIPEMGKRFLREVTVAARLDHPNVVTMHDSGRLDDGSLYYVMEFLDGESLAALNRRGRLPLARAVDLACQLLDALGHAHARGVVHRDVKPDNVVLVRRGDAEVVKLVDFGLASDEEATEKLTATGIAFGTPEYLSPEMATGKHLDGRADLYAVGVMLFEMLSGRRPFEDPNPAALLRAHAVAPVPSPSALAPEAAIPPAVESLILRSLAKSPADRPATAAQFKQALLHAAPVAVEARTGDGATEMATLASSSRRALRNRLLAALAVLAAVAALAFALTR
jgi:serine/threonine-protein kinase